MNRTGRLLNRSWGPGYSRHVVATCRTRGCWHARCALCGWHAEAMIINSRERATHVLAAHLRDAHGIAL